MSVQSPFPPVSAASKSSRKRLYCRLASYAVVPYLFVIGMLASFQRTLIYLPDRSPAPAGEAGFVNGQLREVTLPTRDGLALDGWFIAAEGKDAVEKLSPDDPRPLVIYFPGNGGNRSYRLKEIRQLTSLGCHVLYFDYRGYAGNPGKPAEADLADDAHATWDYAIDTLGARPEQIVLWGESLGGGVATRLAYDLCFNDVMPGGLILRCTFTSLTEAGSYHYPWLPVRWVLIDRYASIERIPSVTCPLLMIHGRQDRIIPFEQGQQLFDAAPATSWNGVPKQFLELPEAGHNDMMYVAADEIGEAVAAFLERARP
jgi:fermentation-respiration switch protein FrsA (DUF1100 family)